MRLGVRLLLGTGMLTLAAAVPSNRLLLGYAAVALLMLAPRARYSSSQLCRDSPPSTAMFWPVT
jgi:hypothetical protein